MACGNRVKSALVTGLKLLGAILLAPVAVAFLALGSIPAFFAGLFSKTQNGSANALAGFAIPLLAIDGMVSSTAESLRGKKSGECGTHSYFLGALRNIFQIGWQLNPRKEKS